MDNGSEANTIINLTQKLLDSIAKKDWEVYLSLNDEKLTAIEPESLNNIIEGLEFHKYYFDLPNNQISKIRENIFQPSVKIVGEVAIVSYRRFTQLYTIDNELKVFNNFETRIWKKTEEDWKVVHFHRSFIN